MKKQKHVFWQAFVLTVVVFLIGLLVGFSIENLKSSSIHQRYVQSEIKLGDIKLQAELLNDYPIKDCVAAETYNINFGDSIYEDAKVLSRYEESNKISDAIKTEHKNFDLLRAIFWVNSMKIKEKCNSSFINIVYMYQYNEPNLEKKAQQEVYSNLLMNLKNNYGDRLILIPMSGDNGLASVNTLMVNYGITELPTILINEKIKVTGIITLEELDKIIKNEMGGEGILKLN
jgi:hypothetical protein